MRPMFFEGRFSHKTILRAFLLPAILLAMLVAAGCGVQSVERAQESTSGAREDSEPRTSGAEVTTSGSTQAAPEATTGVYSTTEQSEVPQEPTPAEPESGGEEAEAASSPAFVAQPQDSGGEGYGADSILAVRHGIHEGYERVVIDLGTGQDPAGSVPEWMLSSPSGDGVLRITLPSVSSTGVSDGKFPGDLLKNFHVVHAPGGGMFVDVFADSAFTYRVIEVLGPARLVVDFKPSEATLEVPLPAENGNTVLTEPRRGTVIEDPLTISGYSRNFEARNTIILTDSDGEVLVREAVQSNDWTNTWGYFETTLDIPDFSGTGTLKVGANSPRDGSFEGVEIPVKRGE